MSAFNEALYLDCTCLFSIVWTTLLKTSEMGPKDNKELTFFDLSEEGINEPSESEVVGPEELETPLYDPRILEKLDWSSVKHMKNNVTSHNPGEGFKVRPLCKEDYDKGFMKLLAQLTKVGDTTKETFQERFEYMRSCPGHYYITVVEDLNTGRVIAAATLAVELKFIRSCAKRARLEDVVVDDSYRGKQLGKLIVTTITLLAKAVGCYKIGLDCRDTIKFFYESMGYKGEEGNDRTLIIRF